jgi:hypothetical protein
MFVAGWTPGGAPYGIFEDEMDVGMNDLTGERDQPWARTPAFLPRASSATANRTFAKAHMFTATYARCCRDGTGST